MLPKFLASKHGLVLAWNQGYRKIISNSNFINALGLIHDENFIFHKFGVVTVDIKELFIYYYYYYGCPSQLLNISINFIGSKINDHILHS